MELLSHNDKYSRKGSVPPEEIPKNYCLDHMRESRKIPFTKQKMVSLDSLDSGCALILGCPEKETMTQDRAKIPETKVETI